MYLQWQHVQNVDTQLANDYKNEKSNGILPFLNVHSLSVVNNVLQPISIKRPNNVENFPLFFLKGKPIYQTAWLLPRQLQP